MAVVPFKRARRRRLIRYYLITDEGPRRVPLKAVRDLMAGEIALPQFANTLQHFVEVLIEEDENKVRKINARGTSTRFDAEGKVDLHHGAEAVGILLEGAKPRRIADNVLDIGTTLSSRQADREASWRPSNAALRLIRADIEGKGKLPVLFVSRHSLKP